MSNTLLSILFLIFVLNNSGSPESGSSQDVLFQPQDKEILSEIFSLFSEQTEIPVSELMVNIGTYLKETPYVAHTLEISPNHEKLVVNLREMDCTTFAENCLALTRTIKSKNHTFEQFIAELQKIRYRNGEIDGYNSRLHYFSDWIFDNDKKQIVKSMSKEVGGEPVSKEINFMSTHPASYTQLKNNAGLIQKIELTEKSISDRKTYFIPKEKISTVEEELMEGDIVGISTGIAGLDAVHVGILVRKAGRIYLLHASSDAKKVVVSSNTLEDYLLRNTSVTGIFLCRPNNIEIPD
jgi:hypothetical protein